MTTDSRSRKLLKLILVIVALGVAVFVVTSAVLLTASSHRHSASHVPVTP
jgi:hypothetical protein